MRQCVVLLRFCRIKDVWLVIAAFHCCSGDRCTILSTVLHFGGNGAKPSLSGSDTNRPHLLTAQRERERDREVTGGQTVSTHWEGLS